MVLSRLVAVTLAVTSPAVLAPAAAQAAPKLPNSTAGAKKCSSVQRFGFTIRVYITRGKSLSCARARFVMSRPPLKPLKGYEYYDWTKGGNGPWSDVWESTSGRTVIAGIIRA